MFVCCVNNRYHPHPPGTEQELYYLVAGINPGTT
jgi:hypothetical protein